MLMSVIPSMPQGLRDQLIAGRVVPFIGAGLSMSCGLPDWAGLLRNIVEWSLLHSVPLRQSDAIVKAIDSGNLDQASHAIAEGLGDQMSAALREILARPGLEPTTLHRLLANISWPAILTTNFDNLLETVLPEIEVLTWRERERIIDVLRSGVPHLMLVHGSVNQPESIVLSPSEYRESMRNPAQSTYLGTLLSQYTFLFIGCSLTDPDIKLFLENGVSAFGKSASPHYALLPSNYVNDIAASYWRDNFAIQLIEYIPTPGHPEVEAFVRQVTEQVPASMVRDKVLHVEALTSIRAIPGLSATEYLGLFQRSCERLAQAGFTRTAWTELNGELQRCGSDVTPRQRIDSAIAIAKLAVDDQQYFSATAVLENHEPFLGHPTIDQSHRFNFERTRFIAYLEEYRLVEAEASALRLSDLDSTGAIDSGIFDQLLVAQFLHGNLTIDGESGISAYSALGSRLESLAMAGRLDDALTQLSLAADSEKARSQYEAAAWLFSKRAELLHLDCRDEEALAELEQNVVPIVGNLNSICRIKLQRNLDSLGFRLGKAGAIRRYNVASDVNIRSHSDQGHLLDLLSAERASSSMKHYDSLPPLWRDLRRSYLVSDWNGRSGAHDRMAREALAAGWICQTVFHAMVGENIEVLKLLVDFLSNWRNPEFIATSLKFVFQWCWLTRHISAGSQFVGLMADMIPESLMPECFDWLQHVLTKQVPTFASEQYLQDAWETVAVVAWRLTDRQAEILLEAGINHSLFSRSRHPRSKVIKALRACLKRVENPKWEPLTTAVLPLATTEKWIGDYDDAIRLLAVIARRDLQSKTRIADTLFPAGSIISDIKSARFAIELGKNSKGESLRKMVESISEKLALQVWSGDGAPPSFVLTNLMMINGTVAGNNVQLAVFGGGDELDFVSAASDLFLDCDLDSLLEVVLALVAHPLNIPANRVMLMDFIQEILHCLNAGLAQRILGVLLPFARGEETHSPILQSLPSTTSRTQIRMPQPDEQEASALLLVAKICRTLARSREMEELVEDKFAHGSPAIRQAACAALLEMTEIPPGLEAILLTTCQDPVPETAITAIQTLNLLFNQGKLNSLIDMPIAVIGIAIRSSQPKIRASATRLAKSLLVLTSLTEAQRMRLGDSLVLALNDTHAGVRFVAQGLDPDQGATPVPET
jgi:hypothetical protein